MLSGFMRVCAGVLTCVVTTLFFLLFMGCSEDGKKIITPVILDPPCERLVIITTDAGTGSIAVVDTDSSSISVSADLQSIHSDAVARVHDGFVYVVNRLGGDNVQILDPKQDFQTVLQFSVGPGSNPRDIVFVSVTRAYVSRNGSESLVEVNPQDGTIVDEISLVALADDDGIPDMSRMFFRDPYLYVAIQRIDFGGQTYQPVAPSYLAVVDTRDNTLIDVDSDTEGVQGILLAGLNPSAPMVWDEVSSSLLVPCVGNYGVLDGGIEKIDLESRESRGWFVEEQELGGDIIDFALTDGDRGYATISDATWVTSLVVFDRSSGLRLEIVYTSDGFDLADLLFTSCGHLVVCDRDYETPGLRVFDAETGEAVSWIDQPLSTGLPPFEIVPLIP